VAPPLLSTGLLVYGLWQLGAFRSRKRLAGRARRARVLSFINFGLSPFLFWWNRLPSNGFFLAMVVALTVSALPVLGSLNQVLQRLGAMLPDESLRLDIKQFTVVNLNLLALIFLVAPPAWP